MSEKKEKSNDLDRPGFHLLKAGKQLVFGSRKFVRSKDVEIKKGKIKYVERSIKEISYVPNSLIKSHGISLKHFESGGDDVIPMLKHENIKTMQARLAK